LRVWGEGSITRPEEFYDFDVSECDLETWIRRNTSPTLGRCAMQKGYNSIIICLMTVYFHVSSNKEDAKAANFHTFMDNESSVHKQ
jgi:hypothetical protein